MDHLGRAWSILRAAEKLFREGEVAGVPGLAYQAVEAAIASLIDRMNGSIPAGHAARRRRAEELLQLSEDVLQRFWRARNIDFYGNEQRGGPHKELSSEEIERIMQQAAKILAGIETFE